MFNERRFQTTRYIIARRILDKVRCSAGVKSHRAEISNVLGVNDEQFLAAENALGTGDILFSTAIDYTIVG